MWKKKLESGRYDHVRARTLSFPTNHFFFDIGSLLVILCNIYDFVMDFLCSGCETPNFEYFNLSRWADGGRIPWIPDLKIMEIFGERNRWKSCSDRFPSHFWFVCGQCSHKVSVLVLRGTQIVCFSASQKSQFSEPNLVENLWSLQVNIS